MTTEDRARGVLVGLACGDALGVPYEFDRVTLGPGQRPAMLGGGLGDFDPGKWSDDTSMAVAVTEGLEAAHDLPTRLDEVARRFLGWYRTSPPDVGIQTRAVLDGLADDDLPQLGQAMSARAAAYAAAHPHAAGNGALMRTAPVALAHLQDRAACAETARAVAALTHADPDVADSCVLWTEAVRLAVSGGGIDLPAGLDLVSDPHRWGELLREAAGGDLGRFHPNGWTVRTLQVAYGAILRANHDVEDALALAIGVGDDTDTVAAVAGSLLGAHHGDTAFPQEWTQAIHGWPGYTVVDLRRIALSAVS
ncbi:ADP-ribosylglycohydrolase family protein [Nocardioides sp. BP30]|uniref:ADP-ribosylglycohydrolase family protein n=1 Tax=Nocardioides sp. BP30 TaxID=3036374 RepID=UPI0024688E30|nr:ADP-ribosylglycohydrolase family protein [Nocardioides sp. BP30]WGL51327.1 ADP-ribosylglycohydrolase family protein [Nocardioides sp. BP30]